MLIQVPGSDSPHMTICSCHTYSGEPVHVDMHVCLSNNQLMELEPGHLRGIGEQEIASATPLVRALIVERLEQTWNTCAPHVTGKVERPDPRFIEAGIRVLDRLTKLYRLDSPTSPTESTDKVALDPAVLVAAALKELEARVQEG